MRETRGTRRGRPRARELGCWAVALAAAMTMNLIPWPASLADAVYRRWSQPAWSRVSSRIVDASGPSVTAITLVMIVAAVLLGLLSPSKNRRLFTLRAGATLVLASLVSFPFTFGLGYRTTPLASEFPAPGTLSDPRALQDLLISRLNRGAGAAAPTLDAATGPATPGGRPLSDQLAASAARCVSLTAESIAERRETQPQPAPKNSTPDSFAPNDPAPSRSAPSARVPDRVKLLPPGTLLTFGFSGIVGPWLLEPHADAGLPAAAALAVALHEFAHTAGYAREAEAEAVGLVAGLLCEDAAVAYAAALSMASRLLGALAPPERARFLAEWPESALSDARELDAATRSYRREALTAAVEGAYDAYLRGQGDELGLAAYGEGPALAWRLYQTLAIARDTL